jgi:glycine C-acetyltransferase
MKPQDEYAGGENFDLRRMLLAGRRMRLSDRTALFGRFMDDLTHDGTMLCMRCVTSASDREVDVEDETGRVRTMSMFGSNNYLGLANHPRVREAMVRAVDTYGVGVGGPPLLNGTTSLHRELEVRLAALKGAEDAMIFASGYGANLGLVSGITGPQDCVLHDSYSHASFCDGLRLARVRSIAFPHNDIRALAAALERERAAGTPDIFVGVEGVYSMDGDLAPLPGILRLCEAQGAMLVLDDAHGTGVMGPHGEGTADHFGLGGRIPVTMGTFSKTFAMTGGFVAASKPIITYLRFFARSYMFSASLPPAVAAAVLTCLDVLEDEPWLLRRLHDNVAYAARGLRRLGFDVRPEAAIIPLLVPVGMDIRRASRLFHERGIFLNSIEYPAVPVAQQRFRVSVMASHTRADIDRLLEVVGEVWAMCAHQHQTLALAS